MLHWALKFRAFRALSAGHFFCFEKRKDDDNDDNGDGDEKRHTMNIC